MLTEARTGASSLGRMPGNHKLLIHAASTGLLIGRSFPGRYSAVPSLLATATSGVAYPARPRGISQRVVKVVYERSRSTDLPNDECSNAVARRIPSRCVPTRS